MQCYGVQQQCAGLHACEIAALNLEADTDLTHNAVQTSLPQNDSEAIVLDCADMTNLPAQLSSSLDVPVIDGVAIATILATILVCMVIRPSYSAAYVALSGKVVFIG